MRKAASVLERDAYKDGMQSMTNQLIGFINRLVGFRLPEHTLGSASPECVLVCPRDVTPLLFVKEGPS